MNIDKTKILSPSKTAYYREVEGEYLLLDDQSDEIYKLNNTGRVIWNCVQAHATTDEIINSITEKFGINPVEAENDTIPFLESLLQMDLIQYTEE